MISPQDESLQAPRANTESKGAKKATNVTLLFPTGDGGGVGKCLQGPEVTSIPIPREINHLVQDTRGLNDQKRPVDKQELAVQSGRTLRVPKNQQLTLQLPTLGSEDVGCSLEKKQVVKKTQLKSIEEFKLPRLSEIPGHQRRRSAAKRHRTLTDTPNAIDTSQLLECVRANETGHIAQENKNLLPHQTYPPQSTVRKVSFPLPAYTSVAVKQGRLMSRQGQRTPQQTKGMMSSTFLDPDTIIKPYSHTSSRGMKGTSLKSDKSLVPLQDNESHSVIKPVSQRTSVQSTLMESFQPDKQVLPMIPTFIQPDIDSSASSSVTRFHSRLKQMVIPTEQPRSVVMKFLPQPENSELPQKEAIVEDVSGPQNSPDMPSVPPTNKCLSSIREDSSSPEKLNIESNETECVRPPTPPLEEVNPQSESAEKRRALLRNTSTLAVMKESSPVDNSYLIEYNLQDKKTKALVHKFRGKL